MVWTIVSNLPDDKSEIPKFLLFIFLYMGTSFFILIFGNNGNLLMKIWEVLKDKNLDIDDKLRKIEFIIIEAVSMWDVLNRTAMDKIFGGKEEDEKEGDEN